MICSRHLIKKEDVFKHLENPKIVKIVLNHKRNANLKNENLCDVKIFYRVKFHQINDILVACKKVIDLDRRDNFLHGIDHALINGVQSQKQPHGFLTRTIINKLMDIEKEYGVNFSISKEISSIVELLNKEKR